MTSNIDERVREALRAAADSIEPPVQELVEGGLARGRQLQRRRRIAAAGASLVAAAVMAGGALVAVNPEAGRDVLAALGLTGAGTVASDVASGAPISSEDVLEILIDLLPPGEIVDSRAMPQDQVDGVRENPGAFVTFNDGDGAAGISITLSDFPSGIGCFQSSPRVQCTKDVLVDGSTLRLMHLPVYADGRGPDLLEWRATLERSDGLSIDLVQHNAVGEKDGPITRSEPPLTSEQMTAIVTSDRWDGFEVDPDQQNEIKEFRESLADANQRLADALGDGWAQPEATELVYPPRAVPALGNAAKLPTGYAYVLMLRDVIPGRPGVILNEACNGLTEKGVEMDSCVEATTPSGEPIYLQWSRSVDHMQSVPRDELSVMCENDDGAVVRVMLSVSDDPELSTSERRADIVAWIEQQIDAMIAAATAEDATTR